MELVFLGTGGGRFNLTMQKRRTGGFLIKGDKFRIHVDPGPGALLNSWQAKENPMKVTHLFVSHKHTDHYVDAPAIIEAMTNGTREKRGTLVGSRWLLEGGDNDYPAILKFHQSLVERAIVSEPGERLDFDGFEVTPTETRHEEKSCTGFVFDFKGLRFGYTADTSYFPGLERYFQDVDVLVVNSIAPDMKHIEILMTLGDAIKLVDATKPKLAILQHFGLRALRFGPERMAAMVSEQTGVRTIAAKDFMRLDLDRELGRTGLSRFI